MPSAPKKRKAAKKKREKEAQQTHTDHDAYGNDDPRSHDERESDGGVASPASHNNSDPFSRGNKEIDTGNPSVEISVKNDESNREYPGYVENQGLEQGNAITVGRDMKREEKSESSNSSSERDRSSSSSSDDDSRATEGKFDKESLSSAIETVKTNDREKPSETLQEKTVESNASSFETVMTNDLEKPSENSEEKTMESHTSAFESVAANDLEKSSETLEEKPMESHASAFEETVMFNGLEKPAETLQEKTMEITGNAPLTDATVNTILETVPILDTIKPIVHETKQAVSIEGITQGVPVEADGNPSVREEEKLPSKLEEAIEGSKDDAGTMLSPANKNADVIVSPIAVKENIVATTAPVTEQSSNGNSGRESEIPHLSKNETPGTTAHPVVRRASWMNCCGLLDLMTGSG